MRATDALENFALNHVFGKDTLPTVTNMFLGLWLQNPTDTGSLVSEVTNGSNYARVTLSVLMSAASAGAIANATEIAFNTASNAWGTITWVGVVDTSTLATGRMYLYASLAAPVHLAAGEQLRIAASNLVLTCD